jgi:hypothetical protein
MTRPAIRPAGIRSAALPVALAWLVVGTILGLVWMHALSGGHELPFAGMPSHSVMDSVADPCPGPDGSGHCPGDQPQHPGPVCQSGPVTAGVTVTAPVELAVSVAPPPVRVSGITVAVDAGAGTGCGPLSLIMLSVSRT